MAIEATRRHFLIPTLALCAVACRKTQPDLSAFTEEEPPHLSSLIQVADPRDASQLLTGWYQVEQNAWRWTARNFAAVLRPPPGAATLGATLKFRLTVPEVVIKLLKFVTLSASIRSFHLSPETYLQPCDAVYARDIPPGILSGDSVRVDFALDKAILPSQGDGRELGVIAHSLSLETK
ncbi:MAG TPA: hypothetical protein VK335_16645 [Bryobacteraceae bacterium]|nr:hypothetical protein [Bryobacteraceae bacterium]